MRRWLLAGFVSVTLVCLCGYILTSPHKVVPASSANVVSPLTPLTPGAQISWPAQGHAAVGSLQKGLLARASDNEELLPTASMAKVITALAILEKQPIKPGQTGKSYIVTARDVAIYETDAAKGGSVVPVYEGMVLSEYQALQMMLIASANNVADMMVEREFGSVEAYARYAQNMLQRMGLDRTVIADASGFSPDTVSTPSELVVVGIAALKNLVIAEIVAQPQAAIPGVGIIKNTNELLGTDGVVGIKTGTTTQAGNCLLFAARYFGPTGEQVTIVGVIMGDANAASLFSDSQKLLGSARQSFDLVGSRPDGP